MGGRLHPLTPPGQRFATTDPEIAEKLAADRLKELREARRNKVILGVSRTARLGEFAAEHLEAKASTEDVTYRWLSQTEKQLQAAIDYFGRDRELTAIRVADVREYVEHLKSVPNGRGERLSSGSVRHYLNSLGNLFRRAVAEEVVLQNPVAALLHKPTGDGREAEWLEISEAARLLEAARTYVPPVENGAAPCTHPLLATFLLTGGRKAEVVGLQVSDVDFERKTVTFRPNGHRRLKTRGSHRTIPLWPQLEEILPPYIHDRQELLTDLLFPSPASNGRDEMLTDLRKQLDAVSKLAGFNGRRIRTKVFRHTYCSARLQTLDNGAPVAPYTVSRELGHSSTAMVERVYSHLGRVRHRSEVVEYRLPEEN